MFNRALLSSELEHIFSSAPQAPNNLQNKRLIEAFNKATGRPTDEEAPPANDDTVSDGRRVPTEDDDCPVCCMQATLN